MPLAPVPNCKSLPEFVLWELQVGQDEELDHRLIRSPKTIEAVRALTLCSPQRSACLCASALGLSDPTVKSILHDDLYFHPYKIATVQELPERDFNSQKNVCEVLLKVSPLEWPAPSSNSCNFVPWVFF